MTQGFDIPFLLWIQEHLRSDVLSSFLEGVSFFAEKGWFWVVLIIFLFVFKRTRKMSIVAAISVGVTSAVGYGMKNLVGRMRPSFFTDAITVVGERSDSFSFPSGHTLMSFACALILLRYDKRIGIPAVVFAALIGFSRVYLGEHYLTDVIAAFLLALAVSTVVYIIAEIVTGGSGRKHRVIL